MEPTNSSVQAQELGSTATDLPVLGRPLNATERELLAQLDRLKYFLATAPSRWSTASSSNHNNHPLANTTNHPALNRFLLPSGEYVSCVLWSGLYHITGTDIVRALVFRFEAFGRPVTNMKKFEEGVFSDLRNLKPGTDACLEEPKSPFLDLLFKYQCIRTQKKQKVFYWFSVPHDRLFLDALERDLKREKMGMEPTTVVRGEPAMSFTYDSKRSLYEQFLSKPQQADDGDLDDSALPSPAGYGSGRNGALSVVSPADVLSRRLGLKQEDGTDGLPPPPTPTNAATPFLSMFSLFEGSPTYKQRRKKTVAGPKRRSTLISGSSPGMGAGIAQLKDHHLPSAYPLNPVPHPHSQQQLSSYGLSMNPNVEASAYHPSLNGSKVKAYSCPLLSCRLLFRRVEHLKRHIRTHGVNTIGRRNGQYACDKPGCEKRFVRVENLKLHMTSCNGPSKGLGLNTDEDDMDFEAEAYEVEISGPVTFEDDNSPSPSHPSSAHGRSPLALYTDGMPLYAPPRSASTTSDGGYYSTATRTGANTPQFAHVVTASSSESSPYVETPDGGVNQWTRPGPYPKPYAVSIGNSGSAPPSSHGHPGGYSQPARYDSPDVLYPPHQQSGHPSSAPSHKATFDHGSLYPPTYAAHPLHSGGMMGLSLRRHRSATPAMGGGPRSGLVDHVRQLHNSSRPPSSAGDAVGHPFAYSVDNVDNRNSFHGSDHSSPLSYGQVIHGEYDVNGGSPLGSGGSPGAILPAPSEHQVMQQYVDLDRCEVTTAYSGYQTNPPSSVASYHEESPYPNAGGSYHSASPETTSPEELEMYQYVQPNGGEPDSHHPQLQQYPVALSRHEQPSLHQPHQLGAYAYS